MTMSDIEDLDVTVPKRIRLRRLVPNGMTPRSFNVSEDVIQKNLEPLLMNREKKQFAQEIYYEKTGLSNSPLTRIEKGPVKQRLGIKQRVQFYGTSTSLVPPKIRLRRLERGARTQNNHIVNRKTRTNIAQQRLDYIRSKNRLIQTSQPKQIRLRRLGASMNYAPTNFQVSIPNNNNVFVPRHPIRRFKLILNTSIQAEIRKVQEQYKSDKVIFPVTVKPASTSIKLTDRFRLLT